MEDQETLFAKWLSGEINDEELRSAAGDKALSDLKRITRTTDSWSMPKYDTEKGYEKLTQKRSTAPKLRKLNRYVTGGIAAGITILLLVGIQLWINRGQSLYAQYGQIAQLEFEEGSQVWLNDGSSISYNPRLWDNERNIRLTGEALFEVIKGNPFHVHTTNGVVTVLGTKFNVRSWGNSLYVECYEGRIQVSKGETKELINGGEGLNIIDGKFEPKRNISGTLPAWRNLNSRFYVESLSIVFDELERQYNLKIESSGIDDRKFSGTFRHDDLEGALEDICKPLNLKFSISDDQKSVLIE